jgi:hypothetical protein
VSPVPGFFLSGCSHPISEAVLLLVLPAAVLQDAVPHFRPQTYLAYNVSFYLSNLPFHLPVWP